MRNVAVLKGNFTDFQLASYGSVFQHRWCHLKEQADHDYNLHGCASSQMARPPDYIIWRSLETFNTTHIHVLYQLES